MQTGNQSDSPFSVRVLVLATICIAGLLLTLYRCDCTATDERPALEREASATGKRAGELGRYIGKQVDGARVLLVTRPPAGGLYHPGVVDFVRQRLSDGLEFSGGRIQAVDAPRFDKEAARKLLEGSKRPMPDLDTWRPPLENWISTRVLLEVIEEYTGCNVVVSLVGLPVESERQLIRFSGDLGTKRVAVLAGPLPDPELVKAAFDREALLAAVVPGGCRQTKDSVDTTGEIWLSEDDEFTLLQESVIDAVLERCPEIIDRADWTVQ